MADRGGESRPHDGGKAQGANARGIERAGAIVAELADALGAALIAVAEEQEAMAAQHISAVAEAARCAARSLDRSGSPEIGHGVDGAADRIDDLARVVREREWRDIAAATAAFARRRPRLFGLGAIALGFLVGRLLASPAEPAETPAAAGDDAILDGADGIRPCPEMP
jgi:uncharacterized protein YjeT (DUF2065 family)